MLKIFKIKKFAVVLGVMAVVLGAGLLSLKILGSLSNVNTTSGLADISSGAQPAQVVKLPKEVPLKEPIPLLWTDDNQGENLIIQSDRRYYDGSTWSIVYFAITNQSGKDQSIRVSFEFKGGKGEMKEIKKLDREKGIFNDSFSDTLPKGKTNFYQARIEYPKGAKGEFIITAKGDKGGYGKLDPYFTSGLVGYWSFNGQDMNWASTTAEALDRSGNANNGDVNGATPTIGKNGQALSFDGSNDYVDCGTSTSLNITDAITIEAWVKWESLISKEVICAKFKSSAPACYQWLFWIDNDHPDELRFYPGSDETKGYTTDANLVVDKWYHIAVVYDGSGATNSDKLKIYVNAALLSMGFYGTIPSSLNSCPSVPVEIGYNTQDPTYSPKHFNGTIDEVRIYNRALSPEEIAEHYRVGAARLKPNTPLTNRFTDGLVGYWSFNGQDISGTTAYDRSGNNNNGTIHGATPTIGKNGQALSFDGTDDYVDCGTSTSLNITDAITIEAWVKIGTQSYNYSYIIGSSWIDNYNKPFTFDVRKLDNEVSWEFKKDSVWRKAVWVIADSEWHHFVGTYDSTDKLILYVDGQFVDDDVNNGLATTPQTWYIGLDIDEMDYFNGTIDEVRIYNRALSPEEIAEHYRTESARFKISE